MDGSSRLNSNPNFATPSSARVWTPKEMAQEIEQNLPGRNVHGLRECLHMLFQDTQMTDAMKKLFFNRLGLDPGNNYWRLRTNILALCSKSWFFGVMDAVTAVKLVANEPDSFLVRYAPTVGEFVLTKQGLQTIYLNRVIIGDRRIIPHGQGWAVYLPLAEDKHPNRAYQHKAPTVTELIDRLVFKGDWLKTVCTRRPFPVWQRPPRSGKPKTKASTPIIPTGPPATKDALLTMCCGGTLLGHIPDDLHSALTYYCKYFVDRPALKSRYVYEKKATIPMSHDTYSQLGQPIGIAFDPEGTMFILDRNLGKVAAYSSDGTFLKRTIGRLAHPTHDLPDDPGVITHARDLVIDQYGSVVILDSLRAQAFDPVTGDFRFQIGSHGKGPHQLSNPQGICVDLDGNFIIADADRNRLQVYSPAGKWLRRIGSYGNGPGQLHYPTCVAVDVKNNLYVGQWNNIQMFDAARQPVRLFSRKLPHLRFLPTHLTIDKHGDIVCVDKTAKKVIIFSSSGGLEVSSVIKENMSISCPEATTLDAKGNLLILDRQDLKIYG